MTELDENGDGTIDFNEFAKGWVQKKLTISDKYAHAIFDVFDENGDGFIDMDELKKVLFPEQGKEQEDYQLYQDETEEFLDRLLEEQRTDRLQQILEETDENGDGKISFEEFHKAMTADVEEGKEHETMPFVKKFMDIEFAEINEDGEDKKFENENDYITDDTQPPDNDNNNLVIDMEMKEMDRNASNPNGDGEYVKTPSVEEEDDGDGETDIDIMKEIQTKMTD